MKPNFYQVAVVILLAGLYGYFVWPTLYTYDDINVRTPSWKQGQDMLSDAPTFSYENMRIRMHRINGMIEKTSGRELWQPYVRVRKCAFMIVPYMHEDGFSPCETERPGKRD